MSLGITCQLDEVLIRGGCQQALDLAIEALMNEGDVLLTTNPTYLGILDIARIRRVNVIGVSMDDDGVRLDQLEATIQAHHPRLIYLAPTHQNPTGTVMPTHRRPQLLEIAAQPNVPLTEH